MRHLSIWMRRCLANIAAAWVIAAIAAPGPVAADPRPMAGAARRELERGLELFRARDYAGAVAAFEAGFAVEPHPDFLYAKAQAQRLGGDCPAAVESYRAFLATFPPAAEAERARINLARCESEPAAVREEAGPAHKVPETMVVEQAGVGRPPERPWYTDPVGGGLALSGLVGLVAGAALLVRADGHIDRANEAEDLDSYQSERGKASTERWLGAGALVAGSALAVGAVLRWRSLHARPVRASGWVGPGGAAFGLTGHF